MKLGKKVKNYIGAGVGLGIGATTLQQMGQGQMVGQVITPATNMMGPAITADLGMSVLHSINNQTSKKKSNKYL